MEKKKLIKELELPTMVQNALKEAGYVYVYDVLIDIYNEEIYNKPRVGPKVVEKIIEAATSAGWVILSNKNQQKYYIEFMNLYAEDDDIFIYQESRYYDFKELYKMHNMTSTQVQVTLRRAEEKIKKYILKQLKENKIEWWEGKLDTREIKTLKLHDLNSLEKIKYLFDSKKLNEFEGLGTKLLDKLANIVDENYDTNYSEIINKCKVEIVDVITGTNTIYKFKCTMDNGSEISYIVEEFLVDGEFCYNFYQRTSSIPYTRSTTLINKITEYKNSIKKNKLA